MALVYCRQLCCEPELADKDQVVTIQEIANTCFTKPRIFQNPVDRYQSRASTSNVSIGRLNTENSKKKPKGDGHDHHNNPLIKQHDFGLPPIETEYELDPKVDLESGFGSGLKRYINRKTRMPRAVLSLRKDKIPSDMSTGEVRRQLELLCRLDHPNIVLFRECFEDHVHLKLVYDWCEGGPFMLQLWRYEGKLTEGHVAQVIRELLAALANAHSFGVHHLDLGLYSLFLTFPDRLSPVKLFGLGLSGFLMQPINQRKYSRSNKHFYASPEMFLITRVKSMSQTMKHSSDIWSVGTILYTLCSGRPPFGVGNFNEVARKVQRATWSFGIEFSQYSIALKEMIELLLRLPWQKRISATQALKQAWVSHTQAMHVKDGHISTVAFKQLNSFVEQDHVRQTVARMLTDIGIASDCYTELEEKFRELDLNGDGSLSLGELMEVASSLPGLKPSEVKSIVKKLDRNGNANVDIHEFIAALVMSQEEADPRLVQKAFHKMDKNGDARVTKKELFMVLRQYSGTIKTDEVSKFIGETDDDGDQKVDYREFMKLFPQVKDKDLEQKLRMQTAKVIITCGDKCLNTFRDALHVWMEKLVKKRDLIEMACGVRNLPVDFKGNHWSYEKGHLTEFEVQIMIEEVIQHLQSVPGNQMTKEQRRAKKERKKKGETDPLSTGAWKQQMMGVSILAKKEAGDEVTAVETPADGSAPAPTDEQKAAKSKASAMHQWIRQITLDRHERMADQVYKADNQVYDCLFWLVKVKSDFQWQAPLKKCIMALRDACVEEISECWIQRKFELSRMQSVLNEAYIVREDSEFGEGGERAKIRRGSRLLPMGSMKGKNLKLTSYLEKLDEMKVPVHFVFAFPKEEITHQKIEHMQNQHLLQMRWVGSFLTEVINSVESLFKEVEEDLAMSATLESLMPSPPPISELFLKHCGGREIQEDAATPRDDGAPAPVNEDYEDQEGLDSTFGTRSEFDEDEEEYRPKPRLPKEMAQRDKIERNHVLTYTKVPNKVIEQIKARENTAPKGAPASTYRDKTS
mmetsp:Transcript_28996/g.53352  ORF Transcript_28996/g.53352 Transcript_28996/m.53352 type:complete len:1030 (+) Transcript_28996:145-3234(+)